MEPDPTAKPASPTAAYQSRKVRQEQPKNCDSFNPLHHSPSSPHSRRGRYPFSSSRLRCLRYPLRLSRISSFDSFHHYVVFNPNCRGRTSPPPSRSLRPTACHSFELNQKLNRHRARECVFGPPFVDNAPSLRSMAIQ